MYRLIFLHEEAWRLCSCALCIFTCPCSCCTRTRDLPTVINQQCSRGPQSRFGSTNRRSWGFERCGRRPTSHQGHSSAGAASQDIARASHGLGAISALSSLAPASGHSRPVGRRDAAQIPARALQAVARVPRAVAVAHDARREDRDARALSRRHDLRH